MHSCTPCSGLGGLPAGLRAPVAAYVLVIALMAAQAIGRALAQRDRGATWVAVGAVFFMLSDTLLALNKFAHAAAAGLAVDAVHLLCGADPDRARPARQHLVQSSLTSTSRSDLANTQATMKPAAKDWPRCTSGLSANTAPLRSSHFTKPPIQTSP